MRVLRAIFNYAMYEYQDGNGHPIITINPVKYLSHTRAWYRADRKQTVIKPYQLADWYKAVIVLLETDNYRNALLWHDYFLLLLFTGMILISNPKPSPCKTPKTTKFTHYLCLILFMS